MEHVLEGVWGLKCPRITKDLATKGDRTARVVETDDGRYVMKVFGPARPESLIANDTGVLAFLGDSGFGHSPGLKRTADGRPYARIGDRLAYLMEFIDGSEPQPTAETYAGLGAIAARLHGLNGWNKPSSLKPREELEDAVRYAHESGWGFAKDLEALVGSLPDYGAMPQGLIHTDIGPNNAILDQGGRLVLIDWDDAGTGCVPIDAGYPLVCQFMGLDNGKPVFREETAKAFYGEYFKTAPFIDPETLLHGALFFAITYMRFGNPDDCWKMTSWAVENLRGWSAKG